MKAREGSRGVATFFGLEKTSGARGKFAKKRLAPGGSLRKNVWRQAEVCEKTSGVQRVKQIRVWLAYTVTHIRVGLANTVIQIRIGLANTVTQIRVGLANIVKQIGLVWLALLNKSGLVGLHCYTYQSWYG